MLLLSILITLAGHNPRLLGSVYFKSGVSRLDTDQIRVIKYVADTMQKDSLLLIDCLGYTDKSGSIETNRRIALKRAQIVKDLLVKKFNINSERIFVVGIGPDTTKNISPEKMRRTDIVVHPPDAILTDFSNHVTLQPFYTPSIWLNPKGTDPLYRYYKVKTARSSIADIYFPKKGTIELGSEALLIVYGPEKHKRKTAPDITLSTGKLYTLLSRGAKKGKINIKTPAANVSLESARGKIGVNKSKTTLVSIFDGYAEVLAQGTKVRLKSGEGTYVKIGEKPAPVQKLPIPPTIIAKKYTLKQSDTLKLKWNTVAESYHVQIFSDTSLKKLVLDTIVKPNHFTYTDISSYKLLGVRISSINQSGLESDYSKPVFFKVLNEKQTHLAGVKLLKVTRVHHNLFRITLKSTPGIMLYVQNNIIETGKDSTAQVIIKKTTPFIVVKSVDKHGNFRVDTLMLHTAKLSYSIGAYMGYSSGDLLLYPSNLTLGLESRFFVYKRLGIGAGIYKGILNKLEKALVSLSYEFDLTSTIYPEFVFGYGILNTDRRYTVQTLGGGVNIKLSRLIYVFPNALFYSTWPGKENFSEIGLTIYFRK